MSDTLAYRSFADVDDLAVNECTIHKCSGSGGPDYWHMWFRILRDSDGGLDTFCVPVNPNGSYVEQGPGGKTWGLTCPVATAYDAPPGTKNWQIAPSINVLDTREAHPGPHPTASLWHHTPAIVGVPDGERWTSG